MDKRVLRERMRKKQQQIRRRQMMKKGAYIVAIILVFVFVIRGIILPVINRVGGKNTDKPAQVQAETDTNANINTGDSGTETQIEKDTNAAIRKPSLQPQILLTFPKPPSPRICHIRKACTSQVQKKRKLVDRKSTRLNSSHRT